MVNEKDARDGPSHNPPHVRVHETRAGRIVIGPGALARVADEVALAQPANTPDHGGAEGGVVLIATRSAAAAADEVVAALGDRIALRFDHPVVHTPTHVTDEVLELLGPTSLSAVVAMGGGSAIGLSKAVSARTAAPQVVVPTTYAGSEVTPVLGETADGQKRTRRDPALTPGTVIYDPNLTLTLPAGLTLTSSLNALAHAVEATYAGNATPVTNALATEAATLILDALPRVLDSLSDASARADLQSGAWLAGLCLAQTEMGLHHQLAHALGGTFNLPHADVHALLLAHVMRANLPYAPHAAQRLTRALGPDPATQVEQLARTYSGPTSLRDLDVGRERLGEVADRVVATPYPNPRVVERQMVLEVLEAAWD